MIDELGGLERGEADDDVHDARVDVVLRGRLLVALDEVRLARRRALEGALAEQVLHEGADVEADLRPQRLVVRLEDHPLRAAIEALLDEQRQCGGPGRTCIRRRAGRRRAASARPRRRARSRGKMRRQLMPSGFSSPFSASVRLHLELRARRSASRRFRPAPSRRRAACRCGQRSRPPRRTGRTFRAGPRAADRAG